MASHNRKHHLLTTLLLSLLPLVLFTASLAPPLVSDASANGKPTPTATASPAPTATPTPPPAPTVSNQVFEVAITYPTSGLSNPWEDVTVTATFTAPSGAVATIHGFYYDVDTY